MSEYAQPGEVFLADCPARLAAELVGNTWTVVVLHALRERQRRPGELMEFIGDISPKVLNETLRRLEHNGLVQRRAYAEVPRRTEYSLTRLGLGLLGPIDALADWAAQHSGEIAEAREDSGLL